jgi:5-methyltetrahydrofolate--homocysteine methyltransferase
MVEMIERLGTDVLIGPGPECLRSQYNQLTDSGGEWILGHPRAYQDIVKAQFDIGCDFFEVGLGGYAGIELRRSGKEDKTPDTVRRILELTRGVIPPECYLVGHILRPTNVQPPFGEATSAEVYDSYQRQAGLAEEGGVGLLRMVFDSIEQMELGIQAIRTVSQLPVAASFSLSPTPKGFRTWTGLDYRVGVRKLEELGVEIVGNSCGVIGYREVTTVLEEISAISNVYLWPRPNAGAPELIGGETVYSGTPEQYAQEALIWIEAGARLISGCCGTTPEHTAKLVASVKST